VEKEESVMARAVDIVRRGNNAITRWDPWKEMEEVRRSMDDLFSRVFRFTPISRLFGDGYGAVASLTPPVDLYETDDELVLRCYVPGLRKDDVTVEVTPTNVSISGSYPEHTVKDAKWHARASESGTFSLAYDLPVEIDANKAKATYTDGVLEVHLPKTETAKTKSVKVKIES
jgi:HSP20 family protein